MAFAVNAPNTPSAPPTTDTPALINISWTRCTSAPLAPICRPATSASPRTAGTSTVGAAAGVIAGAGGAAATTLPRAAAVAALTVPVAK